MSGRYSRNKGRRNEYLLRDYFRSLGYLSERIPLSGASRGFKSDVLLTYEGCDLRAELKVRQNEFKSVYAYYDGANSSTVICTNNDNSCYISKSFPSLGFFGGSVSEGNLVEPENRTKKKIFNLEKLLYDKQGNKVSDFLVIKIDYREFLFLRFTGEL